MQGEPTPAAVVSVNSPVLMYMDKIEFHKS